MDISTSIRGDITRFSTALDQWSSTYNKNINDAITSHAPVVQQTAQQLDSLYAETDALQAITKTQTAQRDSEQHKQQQLQSEIHRLQSSVTHMPQKHQALQSSQLSYESLIETLTAQVADLQLTKTTQLTDISSNIAMFKNTLGITFSVLTEPRGVLRIEFIFISRSRPQQQHTVDIYVNEHDAYVLSACSPMLINISKAIDDLNSSNRFDLFVMKARREFQRQQGTM